MKSFTIAIILLLSIVGSGSYCQNVNKDNLRKIVELYLKYAPKKFTLDTSNCVFIMSADSSSHEDLFFFEITVFFTNDMFNIKYSEVYSLGRYKLIVNENSERFGILTDLFKKRPYEDLNKGKPPIPGLYTHDFHHWVFLMNNRFEILQVNSYPPNLRPEPSIVKRLKKNKIKFAKNPYP